MIVYPVEPKEKPKQVVIPQRQEAPLEGWELDLAKKSPGLYAGLRTAADMVPFAAHAFPSFREEFKEMPLGEKAVHTAFDLLPFVPTKYIGTGLKIAYKVGIKLPAKTGAKVVAKGFEKSPFAMRKIETQPKQFLDSLTSEFSNFAYTDPVTRFASKYKLTTKQAEAVMAGKKVTWEPLGRSGSFTPEVIPNTERFFKKEGGLHKKISDIIERYSQPRETQALNHMRAAWRKEVSKVAGSAKTLGEGGVRLSNVFQAQAKRLFGPEKATGLHLSNLAEADMKKVLQDVLLNQGKILRGTDTTFKSYLAPVRFVFGGMEDLYGAFTKLYEPMRNGLEKSRQFAYMSVTGFQAQLASKRIAGETLGKLTLKKTGEHLWKPNFSKETWEEAGRLVTSVDDAVRSATNPKTLQEVMEGFSPKAQAIAKSYWEWTDQMYLQHTKEKVWQIMEKAGLTAEGKLGLEALTNGRNGLFRQLDDYLSAGANVAHPEKLGKIQEVLGELRKAVDENPHWLQASSLPGATEKFLLQHKDMIKKQLTMRTEKQKSGFLNYLEGYAARIPEKYGPRNYPLQGGGTTRKASYTQARLREESLERTNNLSKMIEARARMQGKELYLYPKLPQIYQSMEMFPEKLKNFSNHYISRVLGEPSPVDEKVATWISSTIGGAWDGKRVMDIAWTINDCIYMGGIGFKPFSAMRNLFQPLLLVPGDLGGVKDLYWVARGYGKMFDKKTMEYVRSIGAIKEYTPDLLFTPNVVNFGKTLKIGGKNLSLPSWDSLRDMSMWMFRNADIKNRYVTGGAAIAKWEHFVQRFDLATSSGIQQFRKSMNIGGRQKVIAREIDKFLAQGTKESVEEAKKVFVRDVIADTQFLYGTADSPLASHVGGAITRTGFVFQTWWMNYGSLLGKWISRSESIEPAVEKMFTGMLSAAIAYNIMEPMWGKRTALTSIGTGPFPLGLTVPPSWVPIYEGLKIVKKASEIPFDPEEGINATKKQMAATLKSLPIFIPGGLQGKQFVQGFVEGGRQGLLDSIIRYHRE
jgi:hypothetical protein